MFTHTYIVKNIFTYVHTICIQLAHHTRNTLPPPPSLLLADTTQEQQHAPIVKNMSRTYLNIMNFLALSLSLSASPSLQMWFRNSNTQHAALTRSRQNHHELK